MTAPSARAWLVGRYALLSLLSVVAACGPTGDEARPTAIPAADTAALGASARATIEQAYEAALTAPESAGPVGRYAMVLHAYGQTESAEQVYRRAMDLDPSDARWPTFVGLIRFDRSDYAAAAAMFAVADPDTRQPVVQVYLARAQAAQGDPDAAAARLDRVLTDDPQRLDALLELGRLAMTAETPAVAEEFYRRALSVRPGLAEAHYGLAQALRAQGESDAAAAQLAEFEANEDSRFLAGDDPRRDIAAAVESEQRHIAVGKRLLARGDFAGARDALTQALSLNPGNLSTLTNLIVIHGRLDETEQAATAYRAALEINPVYYNAHYNYGLVAAGAGQARVAEKAFSLAAEADPSRPEPHIEYGRLLARAGQSQLAIKQYRLALDRDPDSTAARFLLGQQLAQQGDYDAARTHLERLVESDDPSVPGMMRVLAGIYGQSGDTERARATIVAARDRARELGQAELAARLDEDLQRLADDRDGDGGVD